MGLTPHIGWVGGLERRDGTGSADLRVSLDTLQVVFESARRGKHVVTANKALLAAHLPEAIAAFPETRRPRLGFEAAVAGA